MYNTTFSAQNYKKYRKHANFQYKTCPKHTYKKDNKDKSHEPQQQFMTSIYPLTEQSATLRNGHR